MEQTVGGQRKIRIQELKEFWQSLKKGRSPAAPGVPGEPKCIRPTWRHSTQSKSTRKCHVSGRHNLGRLQATENLACRHLNK